MSAPDFLVSELRVTRHAASDDLLTAGLRLDGLRAPAAPTVADAAAPTPAELRRRAFYANWRGIAHLSDPAFAPLPAVPGREYSAFARIDGARASHRVLVQVPDTFDAAKRCLVVAPASGSRGVYGAIALAGPWALPRGCAVAYTDKGAGSGVFDFDSGTGVALDGTRAARGAAALEFDPGGVAAAPHAVAFKHAHSGDNPEADWGRHVLQAAWFGLHALDLAYPRHAPFTAANTRILATGVSNGGGAALRASEQDDEGLVDAVVVAAPNVLAPGARSLYDVATEAALYQPCALLAQPGIPHLLPEAAWRAAAIARCASLEAAGLLERGDPQAQAAAALAKLRAAGWTDGPLAMSGVHLGTDL
ncbi:MAG TPA: 3-hydroxybutyrate oligomer hydrolase family protein, partial [Candidatus Saccharimonadia bacterium]|nr:3-hydroxybutyrate oligomer hydrolase family protein [Candidatus Saccharimonadia bacterium]